MKYIAMNRFKIILGKEKEFEEVWRTRETYLDEVKGFNEFRLNVQLKKVFGEAIIKSSFDRS